MNWITITKCLYYNSLGKVGLEREPERELIRSYVPWPVVPRHLHSCYWYANCSSRLAQDGWLTKDRYSTFLQPRIKSKIIAAFSAFLSVWGPSCWRWRALWGVSCPRPSGSSPTSATPTAFGTSRWSPGRTPESTVSCLEHRPKHSMFITLML